MKKEYVLSFSISFIVAIVVFVILLMIMLPQQVQVIQGNINKYDSISKSKYTFESTKDINNDALTKQYTITDSDMNKFKNNNQYKAGNSDPFAPIQSTVSSSGSSNTNTSSNNTGTSTSANTQTQSSSSTTVEEKTTNSNGGVANPAATGK